MIWIFVAMVYFSDGTSAEWPASFNTAEACEEFRSNLPSWFDEHATELGIVSASWDPACRVEADPYPLDHGSDGHSH